MAIREFLTTQCSWCWRFYTNEPFLCPFNRLQSNCYLFDPLIKDIRDSFLAEEKWWWRMDDMLKQVHEHGFLTKCRHCGALNPNPQGKYSCWHCGHDDFKCPFYSRCNSYLKYHLVEHYWKCQNNACPGKVYYIPNIRTPNKETCPKCGRELEFHHEAHGIFWVDQSLFWMCNKNRCKNRNKKLKYSDLHPLPRTSDPPKPPKPPPPPRPPPPLPKKFVFVLVILLLIFIVVIAGLSKKVI